MTTVVCTSATSAFIPPMLIFPRVGFLPELINISSCATSLADSGWSQQSHTQFGTHPQSKREMIVMIICLPSHCTHTLQPLEVALFKSLNNCYNIEV